MPESMKFPVLLPDLQISFFYRLKELRARYLHESLSRAVGRVSIAELDAGLQAYVAPAMLARVAQHGLRGEVFFPTPLILHTDPYLLGYYRLLYGLSQKELYSKQGLGRFKVLEEDGHIPSRLVESIPALCRCLAQTGELLVEGVDELSLETVRLLQVLTLGPQLRGGRNTEIGTAATQDVFRLMHAIIAPYGPTISERSLTFTNDTGRTVRIAFTSDPDVSIVEELATSERPLVSIEIKGGADVSNIHNRIGEAEKSHQKAKQRGYFEFWTLIRTDTAIADLVGESPTTSRFFHIDRILDPERTEHQQFRELLASIVSIKTTG